MNRLFKGIAEFENMFVVHRKRVKKLFWKGFNVGRTYIV